MFVKPDDNNSYADRVFLKSALVNAFPCGRRRSTLVGSSPNQYYIPFDPEARLNTEANSRKHSGLNGFKQSFLLSWEAGKLSIVINGYLFEITMEGDYYNNKTHFGNELVKLLSIGDTVYANIVTKSMPLFKYESQSANGGTFSENTQILRDQTKEATPNTSLDLYCGTGDTADSNNYYFSGLSFSTKDLSPEYPNTFSIPILKKDAGSSDWQICYESKLPNVRHGETENSILLKDLTVEGNIVYRENPLPVYKIEIKDDEQGTPPMLCFTTIN